MATTDVPAMTGAERVEFYNRLTAWSREPLHQVYLSEREFQDLVTFVGTLKFDPIDEPG